MDDDGPVSKEGTNSRQGGGIVVNVVRGVVVANDGGIDRAVLSREVTNLAGLRELGVTARSLEKRLLEMFVLISP